MNILIIYDLAMNRAIIERFLRMDGHVTVGVSRIEDPNRMLTSKSRFDLVICDLLRPDVDGIQLYKDYLQMLKSKNGGATRPLPFILMAAALTEKTAIYTAGKYRYAKDIGIYDILSKPVDHTRLRSCLARIASKEQPQEVVDHLGKLPPLLKETTQTLIKNHDTEGAAMFIKLLEVCLFKVKSVR